MKPQLLSKNHSYINANNIILLLALAMAITHLAQIFLFYLPSGQFKALHLGFALTIVFAYAAGQAKGRLLFYGYTTLFAIAGISVGYVIFEYHALVTQRVFGPNSADVVTGCTLIVSSLVATWRQWGLAIPLIGVIGLLYGYFGNILPTQVLHNSGFSFDRLISYASIPKFQGVLGSLTELSARTIFAFMLFAGLLKTTGGLDFIMGFATKLANNSKGGEAKIAVLASAFMGMISGSTVANVASTGTMTIPMMKRAGFKASFAGAVESVASTGGQITPPVMGLTAFLMVGVTGIAYDQVILSAAIPAALYYFYILFAIHLQASRDNTTSPSQKASAVNLSAAMLIKRYGHLILAIALLVYLLVSKMPPAYSAAYGCLAIILLELLSALLRCRHQPLLGLYEASIRLINGLREGSFNGAMIAIIVAVVGILVEMLTATGFAQKLSYLMVGIAGGHMSLLLLIAALACLAFGLGLPTSASYILVALLTAPTLVSMGLATLTAHMFVLYFAIFSALTPPVAVAALIAARIAEASYFATALQSVRLGLPGFFLPFLFVARPTLLLIQGSILDQLWVVLISLMAMISLNIAIIGYGFVRIGWAFRLLFLGITGLMLFPGMLSSAGGLVAASLMLSLQWVARGRQSLSV